MREDYALRYLARVVDWSEGKLTDEVGWLRRMAAYKYDSYQDFFAGERFISALIRWLTQFDPADRDYAYALLRDHLVFLSAGEIQHLVRRTVPAHFHPFWLKRVADALGIAPYEVWGTAAAAAAYKRLVRRSLFIGLSDGARIDAFRRANVGVISNEQVVVSYELSQRKLDGLIKDLNKDEGTTTACFEMVFLIDDFLGSGTTLCQKFEEEWKGKVARFGEAIAARASTSFVPNFQIIAHHYIATEWGMANAGRNLQAFTAATADPFLRGKVITLTADLLLSDKKRFCRGRDPAMDAFLLKYYDPGVMTESLKKGGCDAQNGFADGGLVVVLDHNTPNNSLAVLWAHTPRLGGKSHAMQPLFRRRQRHD